MQHGTQEYFLERARFTRRTSLLTMAVGCVFLAAVGLAFVPPVRRALNAGLMRFGFEGQDQYVRRILLETAPHSPQRARNDVIWQVRRAVRGGRERSDLSHQVEA